MRTTKITSKYFNISAKRTKTYTRSPPKAVIMRSATRRVAPLWARREVYVLLIMIILTPSMRTEKNHKQHAKQTKKTYHNHNDNNTNAKRMVAALDSRSR